MQKRTITMRYAGFCLFLVAMLPFLCIPHQAAGAELEYKLKAAFLLNFAKFTSWPPNTIREEFSFSILGDDPFEEALDGVARKRFGGKPVLLNRTYGLEMANLPHLVFICRSEEPFLPGILKFFDGKPVLLVSDIPHFCDRGGMIEFTTLKNRLAFKINNTAAQRAGLELSSALLNLAIEVR